MRRRRWLIVAVVGVALALAFVGTLMMTPRYTATTRVEISRQQKNVTNVQSVESEQIGRDLEFYQTQYSLLEAESLAERVVRRLRLDTADSFWAAHGINPNQQDLFGAQTNRPLSQSDLQARRRAAAQVLLLNVEVSPIRGSALVDVSYSSTVPELSAQIANAWAEEFIAQNIDRRFDSTAEARSFLENRLAELRTRLEQSERQLVNYAANNNIIAISTTPGVEGQPAQERTLAADTLESVNRALVNATAARVEAQSRFNAVAGGGDAAMNPTLSTLRQRRAEVASEYARLMVQFERGYPAARAAEEQLQELDSAIARERTRERSQVRTAAYQDYQAAAQRERELQQQVQQLSATVTGQRRAYIQYHIYQRDVDTNRELYNALLQRYREIGVAGVSANNIAIIDRAKAPADPSSPNLLLNLLLAALGGSVLALGAVFVAEQIDEGLRDPTRVSELLGVALLGSVPKLPEGLEAADELKDPKSVLSEAYLSIRSSLAFSTDHGVPRSLMMVSTQPAEGKTTSALAMASVLARLGHRVVLVDADLRSPSLHGVLGVEKGDGLSNYLAGENDVQRLIKPTDRGFQFVSAGPQPPSAAELLSTERMSRFVRELETHFDFVVIDSPPILGLADAPLLSKTVEAVVFVAQAGEVAVRGLRAALARLSDVGAPVLGVILTKFEDRHSDYGYGYGFHYRYGGSETASGRDA